MIQKIHNSNGLSCPLGGQIIEVLLYCIYSIIVHFITIVLILCGKASFIVPSDEHRHQTLLWRQMRGMRGGTTWYEDDKSFTPANNVLSFCHRGFTGLNMFEFINNYLKRVISFQSKLQYYFPYFFFTCCS